MLFLMPLAAQAVQINDKAPAFELRDMNGNRVMSSSFTGKVLLLNFWAPWCTACREEMKDLDALSRNYGEKGLEVIAITVGSSEKAVTRFLDRVPVSFTVLLDNGSACDAYRCSNLPQSFILGRDGKVRYMHKGYGKEYLSLYEKEIRELLTNF